MGIASNKTGRYVHWQGKEARMEKGDVEGVWRGQEMSIITPRTSQAQHVIHSWTT